MDPNIVRERNKIMANINSWGSSHIRHYSAVNTEGTSQTHNTNAYIAMQQLYNEKLIHIVRRRKFDKEFEDGTVIVGTAYTVVDYV